MIRVCILIIVSILFSDNIYAKMLYQMNKPSALIYTCQTYSHYTGYGCDGDTDNACTVGSSSESGNGGYSFVNTDGTLDFVIPSGKQRICSIESYVKTNGSGNMRLGIYDTDGNLLCQGYEARPVSGITGAWDGHLGASQIIPAGGTAGDPCYITGPMHVRIAQTFSASAGISQFYDALSGGMKYGSGDNTAGWPTTIPTIASSYNEAWSLRLGLGDQVASENSSLRIVSSVTNFEGTTIANSSHGPGYWDTLPANMSIISSNDMPLVKPVSQQGVIYTGQGGSKAVQYDESGTPAYTCYHFLTNSTSVSMGFMLKQGNIDDESFWHTQAHISPSDSSDFVGPSIRWTSDGVFSLFLETFASQVPLSTIDNLQTDTAYWVWLQYNAGGTHNARIYNATTGALIGSLTGLSTGSSKATVACIGRSSATGSTPSVNTFYDNVVIDYDTGQLLTP